MIYKNFDYQLHVHTLLPPNIAKWTVGNYTWIYSIVNNIARAVPQFDIRESGIAIRELSRDDIVCNCGHTTSIQYTWVIDDHPICSITQCVWCMGQLASYNCAI